MVLGHIVVFGEEVDRLFRYLQVEVGVPGEDLRVLCINTYDFDSGKDSVYLLIPPPAQESTMHDPSFCTYVGHCSEEGLHKGSKMVESLVLPDLLVCEAAIVVRVETERCQSVAASMGELTVATNVDSSAISKLVPILHDAQPASHTKVLVGRVPFCPAAVLFQFGPHVDEIRIGLDATEPYQDSKPGPCKDPNYHRCSGLEDDIVVLLR
jgi:hypothetical protein